MVSRSLADFVSPVYPNRRYGGTKSARMVISILAPFLYLKK